MVGFMGPASQVSLVGVAEEFSPSSLVRPGVTMPEVACAGRKEFSIT